MSWKHVGTLVACAMAGAAAAGRVDGPSLSSDKLTRPARVAPLKGAKGPVSGGQKEYLFRGDMIPDLGLGCSNPTGTSGGPNDWATKVTATLTPPFPIMATTYNIFSFNSGPTWDFVAWENSALPGDEIARAHLGAANGTTGDHTATVPFPFIIPGGNKLFKQGTFFFGLSQGADSNGVRLGMDVSGSTPKTVFIRAPGCGVPDFITVESVGFPGYFVHRVLAQEFLPVELMSFDVN